jgi:predicted metal-binding membrane protein
MRSELVTILALLAVAGLAWWDTASRMAGMDASPGVALGSLGWFAGVWMTMMAAMMLPSLAPAAAVFAAAVRREASRLVLFVGGYLFVWSVSGLAAYGLFELGRDILSASLTWHHGGRLLTGGVLALAAIYQLTPLKRAFLSRCRIPLRSTRGSLPATRKGALRLGLRNGVWCLGCSWALMVALFALGVMSLTWMGLVAALVAVEKVGPWGRDARFATAAVMAVLAMAVLLAPQEIPGFVVPSSQMRMTTMG